VYKITTHYFNIFSVTKTPALQDHFAAGLAEDVFKLRSGVSD